MSAIFRLSPPVASEPETTIATRFTIEGSHGTAITRVWSVRTHATCGDLCPRHACTFSDGVCQVVTIGHLPDELCSAFGVP